MSERKPQPGSGIDRTWLTLAAIGIVAGAAILFFFNPAESRFYPFCYFYRATGLLCPGCGALRATHQLLHGHWAEAFRLNPLLVVLLLAAVALTLRALACRWSGKSALFPVKASWLWLAAAVASLFGILRNLPHPALAWLGF